ncbi:MAG: rod-binding protein [Clostridia bacterium]|nr:rod-binding protein [Clostridia bacterium]
MAYPISAVTAVSTARPADAMFGHSAASLHPTEPGTAVSDSVAEERKLDQACEDFESVFIETMLKSARASLPKDGLFSSEAENNMNEMLDSELAQQMARGSGIGLAKFIKEDVLRKNRQVRPCASR